MSSDHRDSEQPPRQHEGPREGQSAADQTRSADSGKPGTGWTAAAVPAAQPDDHATGGAAARQGGSGRTAIIVAILAVVVILLVALGIWWWADRSANASEGAPTPEEAVTRFVDAMNGELPDVLDSISPAEQDHASSLSLLLMRYSMAGADMGEDDAHEEMRKNLERYSQVIEQTMTVDSIDEVAMTETMTAAVVTDGSIGLEIVDIEGFAQITADIVAEQYTDEQMAEMFGAAGTDELAADIGDELRAGETSYSRELSETDPLVLMTVEEEGWYISLAGTAAAQANTEYFTDPDARQDFIQRNGDFTMHAPERASSPDEAVDQFVDALSEKPLDEAIGHLPTAEHRALSVLLYLSAMPQIQELSFGDLVTLSNLTTTTLDVSEHSALSVFSSLTLRTNPFITGQAMEIILDGGQLSIGACEPVDVSALLEEDAPVFAFALLEDDSGWSVSLIGTVLNAAAAAGSAGPDVAVLEGLAGCVSP